MRAGNRRGNRPSKRGPELRREPLPQTRSISGRNRRRNRSEPTPRPNWERFPPLRGEPVPEARFRPGKLPSSSEKKEGISPMATSLESIAESIDTLILAADRLQAAMAELVDEGQARGEIATQSRGEDGKLTSRVSRDTRQVESPRDRMAVSPRRLHGNVRYHVIPDVQKNASTANAYPLPKPPA